MKNTQNHRRLIPAQSCQKRVNISKNNQSDQSKMFLSQLTNIQNSNNTRRLNQTMYKNNNITAIESNKVKFSSPKKVKKNNTQESNNKAVDFYQQKAKAKMQCSPQQKTEKNTKKLSDIQNKRTSNLQENRTTNKPINNIQQSPRVNQGKIVEKQQFYEKNMNELNEDQNQVQQNYNNQITKEKSDLKNIYSPSELEIIQPEQFKVTTQYQENKSEQDESKSLKIDHNKNQIPTSPKQEEKPWNESSNIINIIEDSTQKDTTINKSKNVPTNNQLSKQNFQELHEGQNIYQKKKFEIKITECNPQSGQKNSNQNANTQLNYEYQVKYLDHCDYILLNNDIYFVLSRFTVYQGQFHVEKSQKEGVGRILQRAFDKDFNSEYFHYEGEFKEDKIYGEGKLFQNKSKHIRMEGQWKEIQKNIVRHPQITIQPLRTTFKIYQVVDPKIPHQPIKYERKFISETSTSFHDQLLAQTDLTILEGKSWLNSSIIDAYIEHLNYQDEMLYWNQSKEERKEYQRLYIVPSWLFSQFHFKQDETNYKHFKEAFSQFEPIKYRIWEIYKKIGFVINSSNQHWYFVQIDIQKMEIVVKDSMRHASLRYNNMKAIFQHLFNNIDKNKENIDEKKDSINENKNCINEKIDNINEKKNSMLFTLKVCQECSQQSNGYDCGAFTCIYAKEMAEDKQYNIQEGSEMRKYLLEFLKKQQRK